MSVATCVVVVVTSVSFRGSGAGFFLGYLRDAEGHGVSMPGYPKVTSSILTGNGVEAVFLEERNSID